jgi:TorA maturation chaperone TorD
VSAEARESALRFVGWARVWSPVAPRQLRIEAWEALGLPSAFAEVESDYWAAFHLGSPAPPVSLLLHTALGMEGGHAREEWMRVLQFLGLRWQDAALAPDHLAPGCEALAAAIDRDDDVMVSEVCRRYLLPWCERARERLGAGPEAMLALAQCFEADLRSLAGPGPTKRRGA